MTISVDVHSGGWKMFLFVAALACQVIATRASAADRPPNVVILFADDLGYGDLGCCGNHVISTPRLDRMAREGVQLTSFCVAQAVCGASRAALLTGCYPNRIGLLGAPDHRARHGISADEVTLAELLRAQGYHTAAIGKWHLGHLKPFLPLQHGFDEYLGLPYSNDMWPFHPEGGNYPDLPLIEGNRVIDPQVTAEDQAQLTERYTQRAVDFIQRHHSESFFVYLAYTMPHVPLFASDAYRGKSRGGLYGDVVEEIDASVGRILDTLAAHGIDQDTLVLFTSDNGPWLSYGNHAGSAGPLREGKGTTWEGGVREPCIVRWPGHIPAGTRSNELAATIDVLPTVAKLVGAPLPRHTIDGCDMGPLLFQPGSARSPHEVYYYYWGRELQAIRSGPWKLHFPHAYRTLAGSPGHDGRPGPYRTARCGLELYNLEQDVGEAHDVASEHPDVVERLQQLAQAARHELGDALAGERGVGLRPAGQVPPAR